MDGDPKIVTETYLETVHKRKEDWLKETLQKRIGASSHIDGYTITNLQLFSEADAPRHLFSVGDTVKLSFSVTIGATEGERSLAAIMKLERADGLHITESRIALEHATDKRIFSCRTDLANLCLGKGVYMITVELHDLLSNQILAEAFTVAELVNEHFPYGNPVTWQPAEWTIG